MKKSIPFFCFFFLLSTPFFAQTNDWRTNEEADSMLCDLRLNVPFLLENVYFGYDSAVVLDDTKKELDFIAIIMIENPQIKAEITNHTDSRGRDEYNLLLSQSRADAIKKYLVEKWAIAKERLIAVGYGETELLNRCTNKVKDCTDEEHRINRRSEFIIIDGVRKITVAKPIDE